MITRYYLIVLTFNAEADERVADSKQQQQQQQHPRIDVIGGSTKQL